MGLEEKKQQIIEVRQETEKTIKPVKELGAALEFVTSTASGKGAVYRTVGAGTQHYGIPGVGGIDPVASDLTVYADRTKIDKVANILRQTPPVGEVYRLVVNLEKNIAFIRRLEKETGRIIEGNISRIPIKTTPEVGLSPIEFFPNTQIPKFGSEIVSVSTAPVVQAKTVPDKTATEVARLEKRLEKLGDMLDYQPVGKTPEEATIRGMRLYDMYVATQNKLARLGVEDPGKDFIYNQKLNRTNIGPKIKDFVGSFATDVQQTLNILTNDIESAIDNNAPLKVRKSKKGEGFEDYHTMKMSAYEEAANILGYKVNFKPFTDKIGEGFEGNITRIDPIDTHLRTVSPLTDLKQRYGAGLSLESIRDRIEKMQSMLISLKSKGDELTPQDIEINKRYKNLDRDKKIVEEALKVSGKGEQRSSELAPKPTKATTTTSPQKVTEGVENLIQAGEAEIVETAKALQTATTDIKDSPDTTKIKREIEKLDDRLEKLWLKLDKLDLPDEDAVEQNPQAEKINKQISDLEEKRSLLQKSLNPSLSTSVDIDALKQEKETLLNSTKVPLSDMGKIQERIAEINRLLEAAGAFSKNIQDAATATETLPADAKKLNTEVDKTIVAQQDLTTSTQQAATETKKTRKRKEKSTTPDLLYDQPAAPTIEQQKYLDDAAKKVKENIERDKRYREIQRKKEEEQARKDEEILAKKLEERKNAPPSQPPPPTTPPPPSSPPPPNDPEDPRIKRLRELLRAAATPSDRDPTNLDSILNDLLTKGKQLSDVRRMGGGTYLTRSKRKLQEIQALLDSILGIIHLGEDVGIPDAAAAMAEATKQTDEEDRLKKLKESTKKPTSKSRLQQIQSFANLPELGQRNLLSQFYNVSDSSRSVKQLVADTDILIRKQEEAGSKISFESKRAAKGWQEFSRTIQEINALTGKLEPSVSKLYANKETGEVITSAEYERRQNPALRTIKELRPNLTSSQTRKLDTVLNTGLPPTTEISKVTNSVRDLDDGWTKFTRTLKEGNEVQKTTTAYLSNIGQVLDETGYKAEKERQRIAKEKADQREALQGIPNYAGPKGTQQYLKDRGFDPEDPNVRLKITEQTQRHGGNITLLDLEKYIRTAEGAIAATAKLQVGVDQYGSVFSRVNRRFRDFTDSIIENTREIFRWSIGIGLLYGGMYRLQQAFQQTIENEAKLADITVVLGLAQRDVNSIFKDAAQVATETGESISAVLETYTMAYTAVGGIVDPMKRTIAANKLLADATILNKLSALSAAESIDTLSGALRQTAERGEDATDTFERGAQLLDKWVRLSNRANVDLGALATAFSVTAESALNSGMSIEELNAVIATLSEKIGGLGGKETGNAVRALIGGVYQDQAAKALNQYGISVTTVEGKMRNFLDISEDIYRLYEQKIITTDELNELGYILGGGVRRGQQYVAFLTDWKRIMENVAVQNDAGGASQVALAKKMDTTKTSIVQLNNSFMNLTQTLATDGGVLDSFSGLLDVANLVLGVFEQLSEVLGSFALPATMTAGLLAWQGLAGQPGKDRLQGFGNKAGIATGSIFGTLRGLSPTMVVSDKTGYPTAGDVGTTSKMSLLTANIVSRSLLPVLLSGVLPALQKAGEGDTRGAGAVLGGSVAGALVGSLAGPTGAMIGSFIGSMIADAFVTKTMSYKTQFNELFAYKEGEKPPTTAEGEKPPTDEELYVQEVKDYIKNKYGGLQSETVVGIQSGLSDLVERTERILTPKKYEREEAITFGGTKINAEKFFEMTVGEWESLIIEEAARSGDPVAKALIEKYKKIDAEIVKPIPETSSTYYLMQKAMAEKYTTQADELVAAQLEVQKQLLLTDRMKPNEYRTQKSQTESAPAAAIKGMVILESEIAKQIMLQNEWKYGLEELVQIYSRGIPESTELITSHSTAIRDLMTLLDSYKEKAPGTFIKLEDDFGEIQRVPIETAISDLEKQIQERTFEMLANIGPILADINRADSARVRMTPVLDMEGKILSLKDANKIIEDALNLEKMDLNLRVEKGILTPEEREALLKDTQTIGLYLGQQLGYAMGVGFTKEGAQYIQQALDAALKDNTIQVETPWEFMDYSQEQVRSAANSPLYFQLMRAIEAMGGTVEETQKLIIPEDDPTNPFLMTKDWRIVQYLLGQILKTEEKQLEGIYNLPSGANFYVPFDAYKMGYANQGGGLDINALMGNTESTDKNTEEMRRLTLQMSKFMTPEQIAEIKTPEQAKAAIDDWKASRWENLNDRRTSIPLTAFDQPTLEDFLANPDNWINPERDVHTTTDPGSPIVSGLTLLTTKVSDILGYLMSKFPLGSQNTAYGDLNKNNLRPISTMLPSSMDIKIQPQPIKVNFNTTTTLVVDGKTIASVVMPYLYSALIKNETIAGGAVLPNTYV